MTCQYAPADCTWAAVVACQCRTCPSMRPAAWLCVCTGRTCMQAGSNIITEPFTCRCDSWCSARHTAPASRRPLATGGAGRCLGSCGLSCYCCCCRRFSCCQCLHTTLQLLLAYIKLRADKRSTCLLLQLLIVTNKSWMELCIQETYGSQLTQVSSCHRLSSQAVTAPKL